jgi:cytochrome c oxidase subunit 3
MALSIFYLREGNERRSKGFLILTLFLGFLFLVIKYFEWAGKWQHGIYPDSPRLLERKGGEVLFYGLYYSMTGLHGLHVAAGIVVLAVMGLLIKKRRIHQTDFILLENAGLYWHLVDIVWIFLFPLFYLIP